MKHLCIFPVLIFCFLSGLLVACTKGSSTPGEGPVSADTPTVSVRANQTLPGYPHTIDMYIPSNAQAAVIFLHGGGGKKEGFTADLGLKSDSGTTTYTLTSSGQDWLLNEKVMAVFPQGQTLSGYNGWTWNNYVMVSGQNDVAFLQALVASLKADASLPAVSKFYLVGHSNGGMMANRMWCESPTTFDAYGALAGPPSTHLDPSLGDHPCAPSTVRPYIGIVGDSDRVLRSLGNMGDTLWTLAPILYLGNPPTWADSTPKVMNEKIFHSTRVNLKCGAAVGAPSTVGSVTTYSDCDNSLQLMVISQTTVNGNPSGGDHCLANPVATCTTTLSGNTGLDYKTTLTHFLKGF